MKILFYTENSEYPHQPNSFGLGLIDRKALTAESRLSNDNYLANKYGYSRVCLEEVGNFFDSESKSIIFHHSSDIAVEQKIQNFLTKIETRLNLAKKTEVFATQLETVTPIRVAPFWLDCNLKRRLFLILARDGQFYDKNTDNITAPYSYYSKLTGLMDAFYEGYTKFNQSCLDIVQKDFHKGIMYQFQNCDKNYCKVLLTKP